MEVLRLSRPVVTGVNKKARHRLPALPASPSECQGTMEAKMADLKHDPVIREIQGWLDRQADGIVVLKGAVAALLTASEDVSATRLADYISLRQLRRTLR